MKTAGWARRSALVALIAAVATASAETTDGLQQEEAARPTIGLALGGGGAKGIAHVGVLRVLEELQIPIDYIAGTSMGAVIAGFYASGMSPDEIEELLVTLDWWDLMSDQSNRRDMPFRRKQEGHRYILDFELGLRGFRLQMPTGLATGQKLNNLLTQTAAPVAGIHDFDRLSIPFRSVATDLPTGRSVVLDRGSLAKAQRASMAVPGVFSPIRIGDYLLADGGLLNNIPVDVVKDMGADIVIAVDVSGSGDWNRGSKDFQSVGEILGQTYLIMQRPEQEQKLAMADAVIAPDTAEFSTSDFHKSAQIIPLGDIAALAVKDELTKYSVSEKAFSTFLARQRRGDIPEVTAGSVSVSGHERVDERTILSLVSTRSGEPISNAQLKRDIARIHALGGFAGVTCVRTPGDDSDVQDIDFNIMEKPWGPGFLRFGFRLETDFDNDTYWSILVNYTRRHLNALAGEWRVELQGGSTTFLHTDLYQPLTYTGRLFLSPRLDYLSTREDIFEGEHRVAEYDVDRAGAGFDAGVSMGTIGEVRAGYFVEEVRADVDTGDTDLPEGNDTLGGMVGRLALDTLDDSYFPRSGFSLWLWGRAAREALGADVDFEMAELLLTGVTSFGDHTLSGRVRGGTSFGTELPGYDEFKLGGVNSFAGLARGQLRGPYLGQVSIGYRYRLGRLTPGMGDGVYLLVRGDVGDVWETENDVGTDDLRYGGMGAFAVDTALGPVMLAYGKADGGEDAVYLSMGTRF